VLIGQSIEDHVLTTGDLMVDTLNRVGFFHIGPQKAGTTWLYHCLSEHPEIGCAGAHSVHFFDIQHHRGRDWYHEHFRESRGDQKLIDFTPTYIRSPWAPRRIAEYNPDARILLCLRNPIERAFSHYWHEKKKGKYNFGFDEVLKNYDLFSSWIEPGFYAEHIERFLAFFDRNQILAQDFSHLGRDPRGFYAQALCFMEVEPSFVPEVVETKINPAGSKKWSRSPTMLRLRYWLARGGINRVWPSFEERTSGQREYRQGVPGVLRGPLQELCEPEIVRLEKMLDLDLDEWRT
jgi:hypothetical protein